MKKLNESILICSFLKQRTKSEIYLFLSQPVMVLFTLSSFLWTCIILLIDFGDLYFIKKTCKICQSVLYISHDWWMMESERLHSIQIWPMMHCKMQCKVINLLCLANFLQFHFSLHCGTFSMKLKSSTPFLSKKKTDKDKNEISPVIRGYIKALDKYCRVKTHYWFTTLLPKKGLILYHSWCSMVLLQHSLVFCPFSSSTHHIEIDLWTNQKSAHYTVTRTT